MTCPDVLNGVHAKAQPAALGAMRRERTQPAQLMASHALELEAIGPQHLVWSKYSNAVMGPGFL